MGAFDSINNFFNGPAQDQVDSALANGQQYNYVGANPYQGGWNDLIQQLRTQSMGGGPSLAVNQYRKASQDALSQQLAMSRSGRSPGMAYQAANNMGQVQQGLAQGSADARLREQMAAQQQLGGALGAAGNADFMRQQANQNAYTSILGAQAQQPSMFDQLATVGSQGLTAYALLNRGQGGH